MPFLLLFLATLAFASLYATAQDPPVPPSSTGHSSGDQGSDMDGDGDVDERDEILRRLRRHRAYRPQQGGKRPLDLPSGGKRERENEDEDVPEVILFFGAEVEGNGFFFLIAPSDNGGLTAESTDVLQSELMRVIPQLSSRAIFTVVSKFSGADSESPKIWSRVARRANPANKLSAVVWVRALEGGQGNSVCFIEAAITTIEIATHAKTKSGRKVVLVLGNVHPSCENWNNVTVEDIHEDVEAAIAEITRANRKRIPIDTFFVPGADWWPAWKTEASRDFFRDLATANKGRFTEMTPGD